VVCDVADSLVDRLHTALDDDEQSARFALQVGGTGVWSEVVSGALCLEGVEGMDGLVPIGDLRLTRHMERHDPTTVLRQVAAHRQLLAKYEEAYEWYDANKHAPAGEVHGLWTAIKFLAEGYGIGVTSDVP